MAELKWVDPSKETSSEGETKPTAAEIAKKEEKKKHQPILKVVFGLNLTKEIEFTVRTFDED